MTLDGLKSIITDPRYRFCSLAEHNLLNWMPDDVYLTKKYKLVMGKKLDLKEPKTFNEKLQWLKLNNRKPIYTQMVDKYEAKKYIADRIGEEYVIPTYGVWNHFDEIDFQSLPNQFVLKTTHDSGGVVICKDKNTFDFKKAKEKLEPRLKKSFFWHGREWPYKDVEPRIIAEALVSDSDCFENQKQNSSINQEIEQLRDYKFMCFNGTVKATFICSGRGTKGGLHVTFFDRDWNVMPFERHYPNTSGVPKPVSYEKMIVLAEALSKDTPFLRVDFYEIKGNPLVGELTFFPGGGFEEFSPETWDERLGSWIDLQN